MSKGWPASDVAMLRDLGVADFGENREREAAGKAAAVPDVRWHFVGAVQTNKARSVAAFSHAVHSVDRFALVSALGSGAVRAGRVLDALVQVSLDGDPARSGVAVGDVAALADRIALTEGLRLAGVMAVAPLAEEATRAFARLNQVAALVRTAHPQAGWISAGMSQDLEAAVAAGTTHVRVGSALFGRRREPLR